MNFRGDPFEPRYLGHVIIRYCTWETLARRRVKHQPHAVPGTKRGTMIMHGIPIGLIIGVK